MAPSCNMDGLAQDYSNSIANTPELLQPCTKQSIWTHKRHLITHHSTVDYRTSFMSILEITPHVLVDIRGMGHSEFFLPNLKKIMDFFDQLI